MLNYGYMGSRATGGKAGSHMVVGPDWTGEKPAGIGDVFHSLTPFSLIVFRTQLMNPTDMPNVKNIQAEYKVQPLSVFLGEPAPAAADPGFLPATTAGIKANFWSYLGAALQYIPEADEDHDIRAKLAAIGIGPGRKFDIKSLSPERQQAMVEAMKAGDAKIDTYLASGLTDVNGWQLGSLPGDRDHYNGDWLMRAGAASERVLVGDNVLRQVAVDGREPDQPLSGQYGDDRRHEEEYRRIADDLRPEGFAGQRGQLATDRTGKKLVHHSTHVRTTGTLDKQDLAAQ